MLPTPFPGNGKSKSKAQNPELGDSFSSVFLWARPSDRRWLVSRTVALSRVHVLLDTRGSASWAGREIWCAAGKLPIPPSGSRSSPGRPCDPAVLLLHCLQEFGILARAEAFFPAATIQPGSVRLARGGLSRSWWRTWRFVVGRRDSLPPSPALPGASEVSLGVPSPQPSPEHPGRGGCASLSALARLPPASLAWEPSAARGPERNQ